MAYRCEVYCNTGFNAVDIPDDYYTLKNNFTPWITYDDIDLIQTEYLATLRLSDIPHEVARQVDYIVIEDPNVVPEGMKRCCYTVDYFAYTSYDVVEFHLLLDAYNTFGGFKLETSGNEIISGFANRLSVSLEDDNTNFYTLDEPFQPAERCDTSIKSLLDLGTDVYTFIETTTVPPRTMDNVAANTEVVDGTKIKMPTNCSQTYEASNIGPTTMIVDQGKAGKSVNYVRAIEPKCRQLTETNIYITAPDGSRVLAKNGTRYWESNKTSYDKTVKEIGTDGIVHATYPIHGTLIGDFHNNGRDADILNYYEVPKVYTAGPDSTQYDPCEEKNYGGIDVFSNKNNPGTETVALPGGVYNNKAKYSQGITVKVYSPVSGESLEKSVHDICGPQTPSAASLSCPYVISADVRAGGAPIFLWQYINNSSQLSFLTETIKGGVWRNLTLTVEGIGQGQIDDFKEKQRLQTNLQNVDTAVGLIGGALGIAGGIATGNALGIAAGAGAIVNTGINAYKNSERMASEQKLFERQAVRASSNIKTGSSNYARDCGKNTFYCIISTYSANDLVSYDTFLTQYGYNVGNKRFENKDLFTRPAFNYVRINDLQVRSLSSNIDLFEKVKEQMKMGVRLWHKKPEVQDMFPGGNR